MWFCTICGILFFLLSPGVILTLPPLSKGVFFSRQTSLMAAFIHAVVFAIALPFIIKRFVARRIVMEIVDIKEGNEGTQGSSGTTGFKGNYTGS